MDAPVSSYNTSYKPDEVLVSESIHSEEGYWVTTSPVHLKEERGDMMNDLEYETSSECEVFSVPKSTSVEINSESWQDIYSRASVNKKGEITLPTDWTDIMSSKLNEVIPSCCIVFKRHNIFKCNSEKLGKFWFYCKIEGCKLKGMAILTSDYSLDIINENTHLKHIKGTARSYQSRPVRGHNRKVFERELQT